MCIRDRAIPARALMDRQKPPAAIFVMGPTAAGKTELAVALAQTTNPLSLKLVVDFKLVVVVHFTKSELKPIPKSYLIRNK